MEHPWRMPPYQNSLDQRSMLQSAVGKSFQRSGLTDSDYASIYYPTENYEHQPWGRHPPFPSDRPAYFHWRPQTTGYSSEDSFENRYFTDGETRNKRMRVEDSYRSLLKSTEDERRLKLVRDHGREFGELQGHVTLLECDADMYAMGRSVPGMQVPIHEKRLGVVDGRESPLGQHAQNNVGVYPPRAEHGLFPNESHVRAHSLYSVLPPPAYPPPPPLPFESTASIPMPSLDPRSPHAGTFSQGYFHSRTHSKMASHVSCDQRRDEYHKFSGSQTFTDQLNLVDASYLFKQPHRSKRPDHIVIILRGLPGSGKSYLAKMLRDHEVESGGNAPRIHSIDDYFLTEVEKVDETEVAKSSGSGKGKKAVPKVMEYCYEPEMEEAYRTIMLKAFKKTLEEGAFTLVIVDDRNLRVADFAQFWATAKRCGYEAYLLEAPYKDPAGCAARNVHGFSRVDIVGMAAQWEEASYLYTRLDAKSLFLGDDLKGSEIQEVDMDMGDGGLSNGCALSGAGNGDATSVSEQKVCDDIFSDAKTWNGVEDNPTGERKDLGKSKWFSELDEDSTLQFITNSKSSSLSGLMRTCTQEGKSVKWSDQVCSMGFSIGARGGNNIALASLVIGPGPGYNSKSNPLLEEDIPATVPTGRNTSRHSVFQERLRAERESFKAVFDRRRQRIGVPEAEED